MPRRKIIPEGTPITYAQFRTGISFADARRMIPKGQYGRRHTVLGFLRSLKLQQWAEYCRQTPHLALDDAGQPMGPAPSEAVPF